jgi:hypothetical protein
MKLAIEEDKNVNLSEILKSGRQASRQIHHPTVEEQQSLQIPPSMPVLAGFVLQMALATLPTSAWSCHFPRTFAHWRVQSQGYLQRLAAARR